MMKIFLIVFVIFLPFAKSFPVEAQARAKSSVILRRQLAEINKSFTYRGRAVNPLGIKELVSWIGGAEFPGATGLAIAGTYESDRYYGDYVTQPDKWVYIDFGADLDGANKGWFAYKHLGRLANGYHVLQTAESGGGTGTFGFLLLVEAAIDYEFENHGERRELLVLKRRGEFNLGDKYAGIIRIMPRKNTIIIGADLPDGKPPGDLVKRTRIRIR